jgi:hypothetical protein
VFGGGSEKAVDYFNHLFQISELSVLSRSQPSP